MKKEEIRNCLNTLYDAQSLRIATSNRLLQIFSKKFEDDEKTEISLEKDILSEFEKINTYKDDKSKSIKKSISDLKTNFISSEEEYNQVKAYVFLLESEKTYTKLLQKAVENHPVYINFLADIKGCGPVMAANIIAYLDPYKARHASAFHKYAGLDVVVSKDKNGEPITDEDGNFKTHGRSRCDTEEYEYTNKNGELAIKKGLTYNPILKSKLIGVLATCIIKAKDPVYSKIYYDYKFRIQNMPKHKDKSKSHQNNMAMRYMIKQLLTNLWVYWRKAENLAVTESYAVAKLNMNPHGFNY